VPESFNVLVKEMRALGLNVELKQARAPAIEVQPTQSAPRPPQFALPKRPRPAQQAAE
jgi:DNA-directed RNA polymerase subunit beta